MDEVDDGMRTADSASSATTGAVGAENGSRRQPPPAEGSEEGYQEVNVVGVLGLGPPPANPTQQRQPVTTRPPIPLPNPRQPRIPAEYEYMVSRPSQRISSPNAASLLATTSIRILLYVPGHHQMRIHHLCGLKSPSHPSCMTFTVLFVPVLELAACTVSPHKNIAMQHFVFFFLSKAGVCLFLSFLFFAGGIIIIGVVIASRWPIHSFHD